MSAMPRGFWGRDIDAPNTNWRPSSEDPLPYFFSRFPLGGFIYRWFSLRPLDGHARSNATLLEGGTAFYSRSGRPPFPGAWFHSMPRWRQALITRVPAGLWLLSFVAAARMHRFPGYVLSYIHGAHALASIVWAVLTWLF
jgi:hypothetical protein